MKKKLVFLIYDSRSGSTLFSSLLNQFEEIHAVQEFGLYRIIEGYQIFRNKKNVIDKILDYLYSEKQFQEIGIDRIKLTKYYLRKEINCKNLICGLIELYCEINNIDESYILIKSPRLHYSVNYLKSIFDDGFFIHLLRDPRGVFNSKKETIGLNNKKFETNIWKASKDWALHSRLAQHYLYETNHYVVKYEELLEKGDTLIKELFVRFNIPNFVKRKDRLSYYERIGKSQKSMHINIKTNPNLELANKWKLKLSINEIKRVEYILHAELNLWNYQNIYKREFSIKMEILILIDVILNVYNQLKNFSNYGVKNKIKMLYYKYVISN